MLSLFRYIVIFFFAFNICISNAAEVVFEPFEDDEQEYEMPVVSFTGGASLPHPVQLREIVEQYSDSSISKLFTLAQYFEARYPGKSLDVDFSEDVALIFPKMDEKQVKTTVKYIKTAIRIYRLGKEKIQKIKEEKLAPKDPPLIVSDDQYAMVGDREYIETAKDEVAIISDFKKVIGYGNNPREIEATEAHIERLIASKEKKTDFERFRTMMRQLDWSKIMSYGVTEPSPFVGNAGIGSWIDSDSFRARLISDTARIGNLKQIVVGLHVIIPNHRFILASTLSDKLTKPRIELTNLKNIASYEVSYPIPVQIISDKTIGAYRGDFAFPIKITLQEPNKPVELTANLSFQNCDSEFDCQTLTISPSLSIDETIEEAPVHSAMSNFVHQSLYNIPSQKAKNISLENVSYQKDENNLITKLNFDFKYSATIDNFAFFLENDDNVIFKNPTVIIDQKHIYVQIEPLENGQDLLQKPLTLTARLNNFNALRQTFELKNFESATPISSVCALLLLGLFVGLLFYITPFGFALLLPAFFIKKSFKTTLSYVASKAVFLLLLTAAILFKIHQTPQYIYTDLSNNIYYLNLVLVLLTVQIFGLHFKLIAYTKHPFVHALLTACATLLLFPLAYVPQTQNFLIKAADCQIFYLPVLIFAFTVGLILPDVCALCFSNRQIRRPFHILWEGFSKYILFIAICLTVLRLCLLLTTASIFKLLVLFLIGFVFLRIIFHFWDALYRADLKTSYIQGTEKTLFFLTLILVFLLAGVASKISTVKIRKTQEITFEEITTRANKGESFILAFESPACLTCLYNKITVFNNYYLEKLQKSYDLSFIPINAVSLTPETENIFKRYGRVYRPLYVFYTPLAPDGVVLPRLLTTLNLSQTIENFGLNYSSSSTSDENKPQTDLR